MPVEMDDVMTDSAQEVRSGAFGRVRDGAALVFLVVSLMMVPSVDSVGLSAIGDKAQNVYARDLDELAGAQVARLIEEHAMSEETHPAD